MKILALDLGSRTGWATSAGGHITSGFHEFKPDRFEGGGMRYLKFKFWLDQIKAQIRGLDLVMFEEVRMHAGTTAAHLYGGFMAHLTAWCEAEKIPYQGVPVGTIKKHATGKGNAGKEQMIQAMRKKGHCDLQDDNEADALAILYYAIEVMGHDVRERGKRVQKEPTSCGYCSYEEADGVLISQCAKCRAQDSPVRKRIRINL